MIDEKRLDSMCIVDTAETLNEPDSWVVGWLTPSEAKELIRLARFGLWAEKSGIPALRKIDEPDKYHHREPDHFTQVGCFQFVAHDALAALPKEIE